jgi:hypothetical protein
VAAPTPIDLPLEVEPVDRDRLQATLDGAIAWVVRRCGPFATSAEWSRVIVTCGGVVPLRVPALLTVTSAVPYSGPSLTVVSVDPEGSLCTIPRVRPQRVTFAGTHGHPGGEPEEMRHAAIALTVHRWLNRQGLAVPRRPDGFDRNAVRPYDVPNEVRQLVRAVPGAVPEIA